MVTVRDHCCIASFVFIQHKSGSEDTEYLHAETTALSMILERVNSQIAMIIHLPFSDATNFGGTEEEWKAYTRLIAKQGLKIRRKFVDCVSAEVQAFTIPPALNNAFAEYNTVIPEHTQSDTSTEKSTSAESAEESEDGESDDDGHDNGDDEPVGRGAHGAHGAHGVRGAHGAHSAHGVRGVRGAVRSGRGYVSGHQARAGTSSGTRNVGGSEGPSAGGTAAEAGNKPARSVFTNFPRRK